MPAANTRPELVRFGAFEADLRTQELRKHGIRLRLPNQSFLVLAMLLERPGQLVTREELRERLWTSDTFVEYDQGLNAAVNRLRDALGDSAEKPRFIETLPRRGYRFIAQVEPAVGQTSSPNETSDVVSVRQPLVSPPETAPQPQPDVGSHPFRPWKSRAVGILVFIVLLVVLVGILLLRINRANRPDRYAARIVPFTSFPGQEVAPTFSPDGSQIAFGWKPDDQAGRAADSNADAGFDLFIKTIGSERVLRLTNHPAKWISPAWSPDGTQIAFARWAENESGIFVVPALGGAERKLADAAFWYQPLMQISWSPDGKRLAYWSSDDRGSHVYLLPLDTLQPHVLAPAPQCWDTASPAFSPDGTKLALECTSSIAVYAIYTIPRDGGSPRLLASILGYPGGLAWSSDGKRVIFSNDAGDGGGLWQLDMEGNLARLPFGEEASEPAVAAHGGRLAYTRGTETVDIWRVDLAAMHPEATATKLIYSTRVQRVPQYSPDGSKIVFESNRSGTHEIWLADADGGNPVQLTSFNGPQTGGPGWCSDGQRIAFDSRASGVSAIYVEDIRERLPRQVQTNVKNLAIPAWSQDCRWLYASDGHDALYRVPSQGGEATRATGRPSYASFVQGDRVFLNVKESRGFALWSRRGDDGQEAPLEGMPKLPYTESWTASRDGIYYTDSRAKSTSVRFYDFAHKGTKLVLKLPRRPVGAIAVSPDGRWLLYTMTDDAQSDLMLAEGFR